MDLLSKAVKIGQFWPVLQYGNKEQDKLTLFHQVQDNLHIAISKLIVCSSKSPRSCHFKP